MPTFSSDFFAGSGLAVLLAVLGFGVGVGMDARTRGEYLFVIGCFCFAWLAVIGTCVLWYFHVTTPSIQRAMASGLFVAIATVGMLGAITWVTNRHERIMFVEKGPKTSISTEASKTEPDPKPEPKPDSAPKPLSHSVPKAGGKIGPTASLEMELKPTIDMNAVTLYVDLNLANVGQLTARKVVRLHRGAIGHVVQPENEAKVKADIDALWEEFEEANKKEPLGVNDIGIQQKGYWRYDYSDFKFKRPLTVDILRDINEGRSTLFVFVTLKYMDDLHPLLESTACIAYSKGIAVQCHGHNTMPL
jgi:hypothetical protein